MRKNRPKGTQRELLVALSESKSKCVGYDELFDLLWGYDEDGGPDGWRLVLKVQACRLRKLLSAHGIEVHAVYGCGLRIPEDQRPAAREIASAIYGEVKP
jgi:DNA-binding response OmpR family regulator